MVRDFGSRFLHSDTDVLCPESPAQELNPSSQFYECFGVPDSTDEVNFRGLRVMPNPASLNMDRSLAFCEGGLVFSGLEFMLRRVEES